MLLKKKATFIYVILLLIFSGNIGIAQVCEISIDTEIPVCRNVSFELSVPDSSVYSYEWTQNGQLLEESTASLLVKIDDQTLFTVKVTDETNGNNCTSEPYLVTTQPEIYIDFTQLQLTCTNGDNDNGNTAKIRASASGEFEADEYHYFWDVRPIQVAPGDSSIALGLKAHQYYSITVIDNHSCFEKDTMWTEAHDNPEVELFADPDTAFVQKPDVEFSFINNSADSIPLSNFFWNFNDDNDTANSYLQEPTHIFTLNDKEVEDGGKDFLVIFTAVNPQGCDTTFSLPIKVMTMKLFIPNVFTPNGDGVNDVFTITEPTTSSGGEGDRFFKAIDANGNFTANHYYQNTQLVVFNRQGRVIFRDDDYQNDWDGGNHSEGVYYYVLKASGPRGEEVYKGSVSIIRGGSY